MNIPPEDVDRLAELSSEAAVTEPGRRLWMALVTDTLMYRVIGGHPDPESVADEMGKEAILATAHAEMDDLTDEQRKEVLDVALERLYLAIAKAAKVGWRLTEHEIVDPGRLDGEWLAELAGAFVVSGDMRSVDADSGEA